MKNLKNIRAKNGPDKTLDLEIIRGQSPDNYSDLKIVRGVEPLEAEQTHEFRAGGRGYPGS